LNQPIFQKYARQIGSISFRDEINKNAKRRIGYCGSLSPTPNANVGEAQKKTTQNANDQFPTKNDENSDGFNASCTDKTFSSCFANSAFILFKFVFSRSLVSMEDVQHNMTFTEIVVLINPGADAALAGT